MVGSTVYGFQDQLMAICAQLNTMGYEVLNSYIGTIKVNPELSNLKNCLNAVDECDLFLGIIRPYFGSGNIGEKNIAFEEIKQAIKKKKPYWFLVHRDVVFARQLFKKIKVKDNTRTLACILLFGKTPTRFIPQSRIRLTVYPDKKPAHIFLDDRWFEGHIPEFIT
jgi:hypothetical protein